MKIYLIRHSESEDDILNCYGGCADFDLTENGIAKVEAFAETAACFGIQKVFASPYKRAKSTAEIICEKVQCDLEIVNDIREHNAYGVMSGINKDLAKEIFGYWLNKDEYIDFHARGQCFYGGEPETELINRVKIAFEYMTKQNYETIAIVTHGGVIRRVWKHILNRPEKLLEIADVAMFEINYENGKYEVLNTKGVKT